MVSRVRKNKQKHEIDLLNGTASFLDAHTIQVVHKEANIKKVRGDSILIPDLG